MKVVKFKLQVKQSANRAAPIIRNVSGFGQAPEMDLQDAGNLNQLLLFTRTQARLISLISELLKKILDIAVCFGILTKLVRHPHGKSVRRIH